MWKRLTRKRYKCDVEFKYSWKNSYVIHHNIIEAKFRFLHSFLIFRNQGIKYIPYEPEIPDLTYAPYHLGLPKQHLRRDFKKWVRLNVNMEYMEKECDENIDRRSGLSLDEFILEYELGSKPVIITDKMDDWPASQKWTKEKLLEKYGNMRVLFHLPSLTIVSSWVWGQNEAQKLLFLL